MEKLNMINIYITILCEYKVFKNDNLPNLATQLKKLIRINHDAIEFINHQQKYYNLI